MFLTFKQRNLLNHFMRSILLHPRFKYLQMAYVEINDGSEVPKFYQLFHQCDCVHLPHESLIMISFPFDLKLIESEYDKHKELVVSLMSKDIESFISLETGKCVKCKQEKRNG